MSRYSTRRHRVSKFKDPMSLYAVAAARLRVFFEREKKGCPRYSGPE